MEQIRDWFDRLRNGNTGDVINWTTMYEDGRITCHRALVRRGDRKILSKIDCWDGLRFNPSEEGRIISRPDGKYLVVKGHRHEQ